ncbi:MAG TPA: PAS domain-containing protein [Ramlibacter sp.]|nr:PAS domain-containing protein [Ramlibacter sp.]
MTHPPQTSPSALSFLAGGGSTGELLRSHDWASTPLGPPDGWPRALKTLAGIMLASNQPMFVAWGHNRRTLLYNDPYAEILADKHPRAMGRDLLQVWAEVRDEVEPIALKSFSGEPVQMHDIQLALHRRGRVEEAHFSFFYSPVRDENDAIGGIFCACNETTRQVSAQLSLRESEARHRGVLAHMDEAFSLYDRDFRLLEINDAALAIESRRREAMLGRSHWELYPGTRDRPIGRLYQACLADGQPRTLEHCVRFADGRELWLEVRANPTPEGLALFYRDVSAQRRLAEEARLTAERVQLALDAGAIVGTWVWDVDHDRFMADARFAATFGVDEQACRMGLPLQQVMPSIHPDDQPRVEAAVTDALRDGGAYRCEYRVRRADGVYRWVEANGHVEADSNGLRRFPGVLMDISDRRRAEAERDESNALLRAILEAVPGLVYAKDLEGRMLLANRGTAEVIGMPHADFLGRTDLQFLADARQAKVVMATDRRVMDSGETEQVEEEVLLSDGTPALWLSTKAPLLNAEGDVVGLVGASIDISERKRSEEALRESDRRKSEFLAVLSHELRNPLAPIRNSLYLLDRAAPGSSVATRALEVIRRQSDHLARLVDDLLDITRISSGKIELQLQRLDLREPCRKAAIDLQSMLVEAGIELRLELDAQPLWVDADETRISQLIGNLLHNAIKFTPAGGLVWLQAQREGTVARLAVRDTGAGMDPATLPRMFEPFAQGEQSTARTRGGLGLGLPLVKALAEMHGGAIEASSEGPGTGAQFVVSLPLASKQEGLACIGAAELFD